MEPFVSLLIFVLAAAVLLWLASYILAHVPVDPMPRNLILALIGILLLLYFLRMIGVL